MEITELLKRAAGRVNHHERPHFIAIKNKYKLRDQDLDTYLDLVRLFEVWETNPSLMNPDEVSNTLGMKTDRLQKDTLALKKAGLIIKKRVKQLNGWFIHIELLPGGLTYILLITNYHPR